MHTWILVIALSAPAMGAPAVIKIEVASQQLCEQRGDRLMRDLIAVIPSSVDITSRCREDS